MFCRKCGKEVVADYKFCIYCGNPVRQIKAPEPKEQEPAELNEVAEENVVEQKIEAPVKVEEVKEEIKEEVKEVQKEPEAPKKVYSELEKALNNIQNRQKKCPHCGMLVLTEAKFCKNCGKQV